ncbi:MAG: YciI family protein [Streptosporangiaceae bacterium]
MRYMLLVCGQEEPDDPTAQHPEDEPCWAPWARELQARGVLLVEGSQLQPVSMATTVRNSGDEVLVSDGPFAETKEQILGYDVIECADLDEAIYAASRHPATLKGGVVEVRPILASV